MIYIIRQRLKENNAVTDVVGTMLLIAISLGLFSIVYVSVLSVPYSPPTPTANIACLVDENTIILEHYGGDDLEPDTKILLLIDGVSSEIDLENMGKAYDWDSNNNNKWNLGERIEYDAGNLGGKSVNIQIVDAASNSLITTGIISAKNPILTAIDNILYEQSSSPITLTAGSTGIDPENVTLWYKWEGYWNDSFVENDKFTSSHHNMTFSNGDYTSVNMSGLGENTFDYVDSDESNVDTSPDYGSHGNFNNEKAKDGNYDEIEEENTNGGNEFIVTDDSSNVDGTSDIGTHNDFTDQQTLDGSYDVLTEENTEGGTVVTTLLSDDFESGLGNWNTDWEIVTGGYYTSAISSVECDRWDDYLISKDLDTSTATKISISFRYRVDDIDSNDDVYVYYYDGSSFDEIEEIGDDSEDTWHTYTHSFENEGATAQYFIEDFRLGIDGDGIDSGENLWVDDVLIESEISNYNYQLNLETQWTGLEYNKTNEYLCIYAGSVGTENINVDVWDGDSWEPLFSDLSTGWNNESISDYLTGSTLTIRYQGGTEILDNSQDTWQIDVSLIHTWENNYELDLEVQWTGIADSTLPNEEVCIYTGDLTAESIGVEYWTGSNWVTLDSELDSFQWNNYSVDVKSDTFTIRFVGGTETSDTQLDNWQIDAVLLHLFRLDDAIYYEGNITSIPIKKPSSSSWGTFYATINNSAKSVFEIHDSEGNILKGNLDGSGNVITSDVTEDTIYLHGEFNGSVRLDEWKITLTGQGWKEYDTDNTSPWIWSFPFEDVEKGFTLEYWFYSVGKKTGWADEQIPDSPAYDTRCQYQP